MSNNKVFWEQRPVKKTCFIAKVVFLFSSHHGVFFGKEYAPVLECCFWRKILKIRCRIFSCLYNRLNPSFSDLTEAMTVIKIICSIEFLAESLTCISESFNKPYFVVSVCICIMGERDGSFQALDSTEYGQSSWDHHEAVSCHLLIHKLIK